MGKGVGHLGKTAIYPVVYPFRVRNTFLKDNDNKGSSRLAVSFLRPLIEDLRHIQGFGLLWAVGSTTGITLNEYHSQTSEFDEAELEGVTLIIDAFSPNDPIYPHGGKQVFDQLYAGKKNVFYVHYDGKEDLREFFKRMANLHGPIAKVDLYGHGLPAYALDLKVSSSQVKRWAQYSPAGKPLSNYADLDEVDMKGVFAEKVMIRLDSCFVGSGIGGEAWAANFGHAFSQPNTELTLFTSRVQIYPNLFEVLAGKTGLPLPKLIRGVSDPISKSAMAPLTIYSASSINNTFPKTDLPFVFDRVRVTEITPRHFELRKEILDQSRAAEHDMTLLRWIYERNLSNHFGEMFLELERDLKAHDDPAWLYWNDRNKTLKVEFLSRAKNTDKERVRLIFEKYQDKYPYRYDPVADDFAIDYAPYVDGALKATRDSKVYKNIIGRIKETRERLDSATKKVDEDLEAGHISKQEASKFKRELEGMRAAFFMNSKHLE